MIDSGVATVGGADRARGARSQGEAAGDLAVGGRGAVGHGAQGRPDSLLQRAADGRQAQVKRNALPGEVLAELRGGAVDDTPGARLADCGRGALVVWKVNAAQLIGIIGDEHQRAERAGN